MKAPSRAMLRLLGNEFASWWTFDTITDLFDDAGVELGPDEAAATESGVRRGRMAQYLVTLDLTKPVDVAKLYEVMNTVLLAIVDRLPDSADWLAKFERQLQRDGIPLDPVTHQIAMAHGVTLTEHALNALPDASAIHEHLSRLNDNIDKDPRLAVSVAKDLVESTAKLVMQERGISYDAKEDLPKLVAQAQKALALHAGGVSTASDEAKQLKTILGSLASLTQGITELRNKVGVGHGRESVPTWVRPRHARLAAGAAHVWCQLMLETLADAEAPWRNGPATARSAQ